MLIKTITPQQFVDGGYMRKGCTAMFICLHCGFIKKRGTRSSYTCPVTNCNRTMVRVSSRMREIAFLMHNMGYLISRAEDNLITKAEDYIIAVVNLEFAREYNVQVLPNIPRDYSYIGFDGDYGRQSRIIYTTELIALSGHEKYTPRQVLNNKIRILRNWALDINFSDMTYVWRLANLLD